MSTVVCQGLQSCLESQLVETRTLRLKLASPKPPSSESTGLAGGTCMSDVAAKEVREMCHHEGGWSFLQALSNTSQNPKEALDRESPYVPPLFKQSSSSMLSEKSLELCTESLGSETGTDITESSIFFSVSSLDLESTKTLTSEQTKSRQHVESRKVNPRNFPPPLTTIRGVNSLRVRPHREGGRLIIKAMETPSTHTCLQAERSRGRLRLCFLKDFSTNFDSEMEENEESNVDIEKDEFENETNDEQEDQEEEEEEAEQEEEEEEEEELDEEEDERGSGECVSKDMDGNSFDVGVQMGMEKFQRPSRCKEGGHSNEGLCNWESLWVATS